MSELVEFLRARLAEDEQVAKDATPGPWWDDTPEGAWGESPDAVVAAGTGMVAKLPVSERGGLNALHIERHDPARVLAEVEAKRKLIERYERAVRVGGSSPSDFMRGQDDGYEQACLDAIRDAAEVYADHPDYRDEWRPA